MVVDIIIYHNPECGTSRNTLRAQLQAVFEKTGARRQAGAGEPGRLPPGDRVAVNNSFGFGGHNAVAVFRGA